MERGPALFNTGRQSRMLLDAVGRSFCIGRPANFFITLHLKRASIEPSGAHKFIGKFLKCLGDWYRRTVGGSPIFIWQLENPSYFDEQDNLRGGLNAHLLVHVPIEHANVFKRRMRKWISVAGGKRRSGVIRGGHINGAGEFLEWEFLGGLLRTARYVLKGTDPCACAELGIQNANKRDQGKIVGKRCGISQSLSSRNWRWPFIRTSRPEISVAGPERRRRRMVALAGYAMTGVPKAWTGL